MTEREARFISHSPLTQVPGLGQCSIQLPSTELTLKNDAIEPKTPKKHLEENLSVFTVLCLATLIAILGFMQPTDQRLGVPERGPGA